MDSQNSPRTYTRRQGSVPLEECLTRQQGAPIQPKLPIRSARPTSLGLRWGVIALSAFTGMGSGVGVMALFMPQKFVAPAPVIATEPKIVVIPPHPEALIPVADNRMLIASVLNQGGKQDPFAAPPQAVATIVPSAPGTVMALPPAPLPASPVLQSVMVLQGPPTTRVLPPPAAIAAMLPSQRTIQDLPTPKIQDLPAPQPIQAIPESQSASALRMPSLLDTPTAPQTGVSLSVSTNKVSTLVDTPALNVASLPQPPQPVVQAAESLGMKLMGVATFGDNRIALIRTSPDATPFSASVGDVISGWTVKTIDENQVVIVQGDQQQILKIGG
jgi:hypothetical protein